MRTTLSPSSPNGHRLGPFAPAREGVSKNRECRITGGQLGMPFAAEIGYAELTAAIPSDWSRHTGYSILILLEGQLRWQAASGEVDGAMRGGNVRVSPPNQPCRMLDRRGGAYRTPGKYCWIVLAPGSRRQLGNSVFTKAEFEVLERRLSSVSGQIGNAGPRMLEMAASIGQMLADPVKIEPGCERACWLRAVICQLLLEAARSPAVTCQSENSYVTAAKQFLERRLHEAVRVRDLEQLLGVSRSRLHEVFHTATGLSPMDYLQRLRIDRACDLLIESELSISDIAGRVGFNTSQHFATTFKRYLGRTPAAFRKSERATNP